MTLPQSIVPRDSEAVHVLPETFPSHHGLQLVRNQRPLSSWKFFKSMAGVTYRNDKKKDNFDTIVTLK